MATEKDESSAARMTFYQLSPKTLEILHDYQFLGFNATTSTPQMSMFDAV